MRRQAERINRWMAEKGEHAGGDAWAEASGQRLRADPPSDGPLEEVAEADEENAEDQVTEEA